MRSRYELRDFRALLALVTIFVACGYEPPTIGQNNGGTGGVGEQASSASSSSGNGGAGGSSSGNGGNGGVASGSSSISSSGSVSSSSSSSSGEPPPSVFCGGTPCEPELDYGCCLVTGTMMTCTQKTNCGANPMFYCDGKEDCGGDLCCLSSLEAKCTESPCIGTVICLENLDCPTGYICVPLKYGTLGACESSAARADGKE
jgi:hypothetical protein